MRLNSSRRSTKSVARWPRLFTKFSSSIRRFRSATRFERSSALARLLCDVVPPPTPIPPIPREGGRTGSSTSTTSAANGSAASAACARAAIPTPFALPFFVIPRFDVEGPTPTTPNPKSGKKSSPVGPNATTARADHRRASSSLVPYSAPSRDTCPIGPSTPKNSNPYGSFPANFATCVFVRIVSPRLARALAIQFVSRSRAFASPLASPSPSPSLAFFPRSARACPRAMSLYPTDGFFRFPPIAVVVVVVVVAVVASSSRVRAPPSSASRRVASPSRSRAVDVARASRDASASSSRVAPSSSRIARRSRDAEWRRIASANARLEHRAQHGSSSPRVGAATRSRVDARAPSLTDARRHGARERRDATTRTMATMATTRTTARARRDGARATTTARRWDAAVRVAGATDARAIARANGVAVGRARAARGRMDEIDAIDRAARRGGRAVDRGRREDGRGGAGDRESPRRERGGGGREWTRRRGRRIARTVD